MTATSTRTRRIGMAYAVGDGTWQVGIYNIARNDAGQWVAAAIGPGTIGDGYHSTHRLLADAYLAVTGEPMPGDKRTAQHATAPAMVAQPVQPAQAHDLRPQGTRLTRVNDNVPAYVQPGSRRLHPAAAQAVHKAFNGRANIFTPDVLGYATLGGTFAAELGEGEGIRDRRTGIAPAIFGVTVVGLQSAMACHRLSRVFTSRDSACLYMGKLHHLGTYRARRRALLNAIANHVLECHVAGINGDDHACRLGETRANLLRHELGNLRSEYRITLARFGCEVVEPGDDAPAEHRPTVGDVHAAGRVPTDPAALAAWLA